MSNRIAGSLQLFLLQAFALKQKYIENDARIP
jgi:hypothetical protein